MAIQVQNTENPVDCKLICMRSVRCTVYGISCNRLGVRYKYELASSSNYRNNIRSYPRAARAIGFFEIRRDLPPLPKLLRTPYRSSGNVLTYTSVP